MTTETLRCVLCLLAGNRLWHVQVHRQQYDAEDILWNAKLPRTGGAADSGVGVVHKGRRLLESWSHFVHLVILLTVYQLFCLSARFKITIIEKTWIMHKNGKRP